MSDPQSARRQIITPFWLGYERAYACPKHAPSDHKPADLHPPDYPPFDAASLSPTLAELYGYIEAKHKADQLGPVTLAFANLFPRNTICHSYLCKSNCEDDIRAGIKFLHDRGIKVLLSVVGTPKSFADSHPFVSWNNNYHPWDFARFFRDEYVDGKDAAGNVIGWGFDGININNEDAIKIKGDLYDVQPDWMAVEVVRALRDVLDTGALITYNTHNFARDEQVLRRIGPWLDGVNLMAYYLATAEQYVDLFRQYADIPSIGPEKICIGIGCVYDELNPQQTPFEAVNSLCQFSPEGQPAKQGIMLWNASQDMAKYTKRDKPRWEYTDEILRSLP